MTDMTRLALALALALTACASRDATPPPGPTPTPTSYEITYRVSALDLDGRPVPSPAPAAATRDIPTASLTYEEIAGTTQETDAELPVSRTIGHAPGTFRPYLSAQLGAVDLTKFAGVRCVILVNGRQVAINDATGALSIATCHP
jgi:hypothetical protein